MIATVWSERIGIGGVIDCDYDNDSRTVVAGDIDGSVVHLDVNGNRLGDHKVEMPIWGVAQHFGTSSHLIAVAAADKRQERGRGYLLADFKRKVEFDTDGELWDCAFTSSRLFFTSWKSTIHITDHGGEPIDSIATPGLPYGLITDGEGLTVALNEMGVGHLQPSGDGYDLSVAKRSPDVCYNICRDGTRDLVVTGSKVGTATILTSLTQERRLDDDNVCAVALGEDFLLAGSLDGGIALFHLGDFTEPLATMTLPGGIWNIALDGDTGLAYVACGDGYLRCLQIDLTELPDSEIGTIRSAINSPLEVEELASIASPGAIEITLGMIEQEWDRWSEEDMAVIAAVTRSWLKSRQSPRLCYILALAELEQGKSDEALVLFQRIEGESEYGLKSLLPFARALQMNGSVGAAIRVLRKNLPRVSEEMRPDYLFEIGCLHEKHGDIENALDAYELVSVLNHDHPHLRETLERLRDKQSPQAGSQVDLSPDLLSPPRPTSSLSGRRTADYDEFSYLLYEYGAPEDEAKKHMETDLMSRVLASTGAGARSLDIGCATGRWPEWFARKGYEAHGYDISAASIEICRRRAEQHQALSLSFDQYDITEGARLTDYFDITTCMMGTFNHVPPAARGKFLKGIRESLVEEGLFVASIWNAPSPFCQFLGLDGQRAKETLRRNGLEQENFKELLDSSGFEVEGVTPFCLLPNDCYRVWEDEFQDGVNGIIEIENFLRANLTSRTRSQMNFVVARVRRGA